MTSPFPMTPPQPPQQPPAPPPQPFTPFLARANDSEPAVAMQWMKRLSKLMFDPRFESFDPLWQQLVNDRYAAAQKVIQSVTPLPALPKGMEIRAMPADAQTLAADAQAALHGNPGAPTPTPQHPQPPQQVPQARQPQGPAIGKIPV